MNLRYANMWDFPLRFLAVSYLVNLFARFPACRPLVRSLYPRYCAPRLAAVPNSLRQIWLIRARARRFAPCSPDLEVA